MSGVRLPKAVREQGEAADKALEALKNPTNPDDPGQYVSEGEPTPDTGSNENEGVQPPEPTEGETPPTPESGANEKDQSDDDLNINWKEEAEALKNDRDRALAQLQTLQGKYNAEVPRLHDEIKGLKGKLEALEQNQTASTPETPEKAADLDQMREMYGDEMADAYMAQEQKIARLQASLEKAVEKLSRVDEIDQQYEASADQAMFDEIGKAHPDWEKVNGLASFRNYLKEVDPNTGEPRQAVINRAQARRDAGPIIRVLSAFKRKAKSGSAALESQVVPGNTGRTDEPVRPDTNVYSAQEIDLFFKNQAANRAKGLPISDEDKRLETQYTQAMRDGRVR
jgi:hypothetical protein